ncbi:MAG: hypothetical protein IPO21_04545 [Bacteroidales bacterium]|nr:hypothetical protein [Bacteroidales bacterium]
MKSLTIKQKLNGLTLALLIIFIFIAAFCFWGIKKNTELENMLKNTKQIEINILKLRKAEKNFLARDIIDKNYFETGISSNLLEFDSVVKSTLNLIDLMQNYHNEEELLNSYTGIRLSLENYNASFKNIVVKSNEKGFKDWGFRRCF